MLSAVWEAGKETRAWVQELGHVSRRIRGREPAGQLVDQPGLEGLGTTEEPLGF